MVTVAVSRAGLVPPRVHVAVQPRLLPPGVLAWWRHHGRVRVERCGGVDAGRLRFGEGGSYLLGGQSGRTGRDGRGNAPRVQVSWVAGAPEAGLPRMAAAWEVVGDDLIVTLPWSTAKGMAGIWPAPERRIARPSASVAPAAASIAPPLSAAPLVQLPALPQGWLNVLAFLRRRGGRVLRFDGLSHAAVKALQACEARGLAEWQPAGEKWLLTPAGAAALDAARLAA